MRTSQYAALLLLLVAQSASGTVPVQTPASASTEKVEVQESPRTPPPDIIEEDIASGPEVVETTSTSSVACGGTYTYTISQPGQLWKPRFCRWGQYTLSACGSVGSRGDSRGGCSPFQGATLANPRIYPTKQACSNDNAWATPNSCCSGRLSGCTNLAIGGADGFVGTAKLHICCSGCESCIYATPPRPQVRDATQSPADDAAEGADPTVLVAGKPQPKGSLATLDALPSKKIDNNTTRLYLPLHKDVKLLKCGLFELSGRATPSQGASNQQWFDQFRITHKGQDALRVEVNMKTYPLEEGKADAANTEDLSHATVIPGGFFKGVEDAKDMGQGLKQIAKQKAADKKIVTSLISAFAMGQAIPQKGEIFNMGGYSVKMKRNQKKRIEHDYSETVQFSTQGVAVNIKTVSSEHQRKLVTHLDLDFEALSVNCTGGLLAELWGMVRT